jgi:hypothetical protein
MIDVFVGGAPSSNILNAEVTIQGSGFRATLTVSAGTHARASVVPLATSGVTNIELSVRSADRQATIYAENIPVDATINILGSDALRFDGQIHHIHTSAPLPTQTCTLRCTPTGTPTPGPTCIECDVSGLRFKLCC